MSGASAQNPTPLRALVVDDEPPALAELVWLLDQDARIGSIRAASSGEEALRALQAEHFDVIFSDIRMPGLDGLDLARILARFSDPPLVVFVTAYDRHALDAFDLQAVDYVMKPVRTDRLREAIRRVAAKVNDPGTGSGSAGTVGANVGPGTPAGPRAGEAGRTEPSGASSPAVGTGSGGSATANLGDTQRDLPDETIAVELAGVTRFIQRSQVRYVEAHGDYARLHTATSSHLIRVPLSTLEERWAAAGFVRIHRSTLISLRHVDEIQIDSGRCSVRLGNKLLQVSRRHTKQLRDRLIRSASLNRDHR